MQTLTLFFGFAIVAIAMENFTAKFLFAKTSDAGAKGDQEFQSRDDPLGQKYWLRGSKGVEKVIIRDGNKKPETVSLKEKDQVFYATNPKIYIEYINDECCEPNDKNVLFTTRYKHRISTSNNTNNYFANWNCSLCSTLDSRNIKKQIDLQSRSGKVDRCYETRQDGVTDCHKCTLVNEGQFCYPGTYTVEFKTENQCENVTYGECDIDKNILKIEPTRVRSARRCNKICMKYTECGFYRYNSHKEECVLLYDPYRKSSCNIRAGPMDKTASACLTLDSDKTCDSILEEDCEYNGKHLDKLGKGQVLDADDCQANCELRAPDCKYWIYNIKEAVCILKGSVEKKCSVETGPPFEENKYDDCKKQFNNEAD